MSEEPNLRSYIKGLTNRELEEYRMRCAKVEDDDTENLILEEQGRRAHRKYTKKKGEL